MHASRLLGLRGEGDEHGLAKPHAHDGTKTIFAPSLTHRASPYAYRA